MPPRCVVPSPRAALWPVSSSQDGIWITDAMLLRAIERFNQVSSPSCRRLSSVPGPIESRRRLGKRHMTGILPGSHATPAPWSIDIPWQLGEWQWKAPTTPEDRKHDTKTPGMPRILDRLIGWLEDFDEESVSTQLDRATEIVLPTRLQQSVATTRQRIQDLGSVENTKEVIALCNEFKQDLEAIICSRMATSDDMLLALNLFDSDLRTHLHNAAYWDRVTASIGATIVKSIASSRSAVKEDAYGAKFWFSLMQAVCSLTPQRETFNLFALCLNALPRTHFDLLGHDEIFNITKTFVTYQAAKIRTKPSSVLEFTKALKRLTPAHAEQLQKSMASWLRSLPQEDREPRLYWASLLACSRRLSTDEFLQEVEVISGERRWEVPEAFTLARGRLWALGCVEPKQIGYLMRQTANSDGWTNLVLTAWNAPEQIRHKALRDLCLLSNRLGCFEVLAEALASKIAHRSPVFRALAIASGDHTLALQLWKAYNQQQRTARNLGAWDWTAWSIYVEQMIKDSGMDQKLLWKVLALTQTQSNEGLPDRVLCSINSKTELLDKMSTWFLESPHLSDRQILRRIERCINYYGRINQKVSRTAVANLMQVMVRDLESGQPGRVTRLDHLISMIEKHLGKAEAEAALTQIRGWRWTIEKHKRFYQETYIHDEVNGRMRETDMQQVVKQNPKTRQMGISQQAISQLHGMKENKGRQPVYDILEEVEDDISLQMRTLRRESV